MNILFEGYKYPDDKVNLLDYLDKAFVKENNSTSYVGYFHREGTDSGDVTFILPKVFMQVESKDGIEKYRMPFGRRNNIPEDFITSEPLSESEKEFLFNFSMWIYSAIKKYSEVSSKEDRAEDTDFSIASSKVDGNNEKTLIEIALSLKEFHRKHSHLLTYITKLNSVGYNNIDWSKTISTKQPIFQAGAPIYTEFANRSKVINFDEELIVLFYSVLNYISEKYALFRIKTPINYKLYPSHLIQDMIDNGMGTMALWSIRKKYFTDELVELWGLVYSFFEHEEEISYGKSDKEFLLINKFENVFEAMVDELLGNNAPEDMDITKKQKDGKRLDHLYIGESLLDGGKNNVYYIGDSKYYLDEADIRNNVEAVAKQYTYAKNIIQYAIDHYLKKRATDFKYRDDRTEGYTITPNFFIRGEVKFTPQEQLADYTNEAFIYGVKDKYTENKQFEDRLFDRDTLLLKAFNINFLYLLSLYISDETSSKREETKNVIFKSLMKGLNNRYNFFRVYPTIPAGSTTFDGMKMFVDENFRNFVGTMYIDENDDDFIWFAFEKNTPVTEHDITKLKGSYKLIEKATFKDDTWHFQQVFP